MGSCVIMMAGSTGIGWEKFELRQAKRLSAGPSGTDTYDGKQRCVRAWVKMLIFGREGHRGEGDVISVE